MRAQQASARQEVKESIRGRYHRLGQVHSLFSLTAVTSAKTVQIQFRETVWKEKNFVKKNALWLGRFTLVQLKL